MEGDAGGVWDVGEKDVGEVGFSRLQDSRQKRRAERLAFAVYVGVVCAGEVDALEGAGAGYNFASVASFQLALVVGVGNIPTLATFTSSRHLGGALGEHASCRFPDVSPSGKRHSCRFTDSPDARGGFLSHTEGNFEP